MIFEESKTIEKVGEKLGYIFSYFVFTSILFLILVLSKKMPQSWSYMNIVGSGLLIALTGVVLRRILK